MKFSIWYNQTDTFLSLIEKYKDNIDSVYFALPLYLWKSCRDLEQELDYEKKLFNLIIVCKKYSIETILVMNATCEWELTWDKAYLWKLILYIKKIFKIGLTSVSLTNLLYVRFIKTALPKIKIYSSVNCYLRSVEQAKFMKKLWIDVLTIDRDINRDLDLIEKIKIEVWLPIQILLNEGCFRNCPFRYTHFNIISHWIENNSKNIEKWNYNLLEKYSCYPLLVENKRLIFRVPFVRPEDLHYYKWLCDIFKLTTRDETTERIEIILSGYIKWFYHWNLFDMVPSCVIWYENM